jgi:cell division protein FtsN
MRIGNRDRSTTLTGIAIGIVAGVLLSLLVVWFMNRNALPFREQSARIERPADTGKIEPLPNKPGDKVGEKAGDKTGDKGDDKPRFDFYTILPNSQETSPASRTGESRSTKTDEPLWLQAGAFQKPAEADNLKAKLALLGLDAGVQEVTLPEKGKMYRVRVGPFKTAEDMSQANSLLSQNGIQATQVKNR